MRRDSVGVYSIGAVATMLGIRAQTLRSWEDRYGQIVPTRSPGGQRLYSRDQVDELRFVCEQVASGLQPAVAHRLLAERRRPAEQAGPQALADNGMLAPSAGRVTPDSHGVSFMILLAERDPYAAEYAEYFLRTEGYVARVAVDAGEAQRILHDHAPNLVVIDLMISGGAGLTLCATTRKNSSVPILAISAIDSGDVALEAGADAFLQKPFDPLQFISTVRDLLGTSAYLRPRSRIQ
ncbi:MerR family transcriptional regulator [Jiangella aurantiaca]|uniref:MerR family transcriptional regulator n=1 Tax=Jiangella aurantiaca TaxID=2530373 RepID=A0A4R5AGU6_9ACTN|nr:MerR family transcriptional regulator [Jiangella aurantiaca]TDD71878.1 MerR family transcriptional regulator [Jiangella aurantiaca]